MTIYRHVMSGPGPEGDVWSATLHSESAQTISTVHTAYLAFLSSLIGTTMVPLWSTDTECTAAVTDQLDPVTGANVAQERTALTYVGTATDQVLPQRVAVVIGLRTALPTRAGRGRFYLPAPTIASLTSTGLLSTTVAASLATAAASALNTMASTSAPGVYHRSTISITSVNQVTVAQVLGSQRRRTNKVPPDYSSANL